MAEIIHLKDKTKVLPQIPLQFFGGDENGEKPTEGDLVCVECQKKGISIGAVKADKDGEPQYVCEECAIEDFQLLNGFGSVEAAAAYRRRMFDVSYLFIEILIEAYFEKFKTDIDNIDEDLFVSIMSLGRTLYDELPKDELIEITYLEDVNELKTRLAKLVEEKGIKEEFFQDLITDQEAMEMVERIMKKLDPEEQAFFMSVFTVAFDGEEFDDIDEEGDEDEEV